MTAPERYVLDSLLPPASGVSAIRQQVRRVDVHWHDFYEIGYVTGGSAVHRVNGRARDLRPGSAFLLTPADFHEILGTSQEPLHYYNVVVDPWLLEGGRFAGVLPAGFDAAARSTDAAHDLEADFRRLHRETMEDRPGSAELRRSVLGCLLIELVRLCPPRSVHPEPAAGRDGTDIRDAVLFVDRHFREPLTLAGVAAQVHLSPNYFSERFREFADTSFQVYLQHRRLRFARSLLSATDVGVTEVCHASGFNSLSHFGRVYRARYGESPSETRQRAVLPGAATVAG